MNYEHTEQCEHIDGKLERLEGRFDDHLKIYAANGKESARVAACLEKMMERSEERDKKVDEMFTAYSEFKNGRKAIVWFFGAVIGGLTTIGGLILMLKQILK